MKRPNVQPMSIIFMSSHEVIISNILNFFVTYLIFFRRKIIVICDIDGRYTKCVLPSNGMQGMYLNPNLQLYLTLF